MNMNKCKHNWHVSSYTGVSAKSKLRKKCWPQIWHKCSKCESDTQRNMTDEEVEHYREKQKKQLKEIDDLHKLWHKFSRQFKIDDNKWKLGGWKFIKAAEKFTEKNPEVVITRCDDACFTGSVLVLIPHATEKRIMGITVVVIPQNSGYPTEIFLYPHHTKDLISALIKMPKGKKGIK